jgi:hypothetical protein
MAEFTVTDEISLGDAVWRSGRGDTIRFLEGTYGRVIVKGCSVIFPADRRVKIGQLVGYGGTVVNATMDDTIKSIFIYRKLLPINLRIKPDQSIFHPTGAAVTCTEWNEISASPPPRANSCPWVEPLVRVCARSAESPCYQSMLRH